MKHPLILLIAALWLAIPTSSRSSEKVKCPIIDTGQDKCYDASKEITAPRAGQPFYGQDAQYAGNAPYYKDNGDGTVTDLITGLIWSKAVDPHKLSLDEAEKAAKTLTLAGKNDWRVPNIKELYSLIDFRGYTGFANGGSNASVPANAIPFINTDYFDFRFGDTKSGERYIDAQWLTSTRYVSTTMGGSKTLFGVNFADGRIKGYGYEGRGNRPEKKFYVRYVRGPAYGQNDFVDNGDGTITDQNTGLMWMQKDSGKGMTWEKALAYAESLSLAGHNDWRLPNAKELQSIVDYTRSPDTTKSPAIDPVFRCTEIKNEAGQKDYAFYWTSTTHADGPNPCDMAAYVSFGRAIGQMRGRTMDVHGAGAQRSDPKTGKAELDHGPQGDARRVLNFVRCVRGGGVTVQARAASTDKSKYPFVIRVEGRSSRPTTTRPDGRPSFVSRLDKNGDGKVSRDEFDGPKRHFNVLDRDGDGYLSEDEAPKAPPRR